MPDLHAKTAALAMSVIGIVISAYLTLIRYTSTPVACPDTGIINCGTVLSSQYSTIFGVPNAVLGIVFFAIEIIFVYKYFGREQMLLLNGVGLAFVLYFISTEYVLKAICIYCTAVHLCVIGLLAISLKYQDKVTS